MCTFSRLLIIIVNLLFIRSASSAHQRSLGRTCRKADRLTPPKAVAEVSNISYLLRRFRCRAASYILSQHHASPAAIAFVHTTQPFCSLQLRHYITCPPQFPQIENKRRATLATMATNAEINEQISVTTTASTPENNASVIAVVHITSILQNSIDDIESGTISQAIALLEKMRWKPTSDGESTDEHENNGAPDIKIGAADDTASTKLDIKSQLDLLAETTVSTIQSLHDLVNDVNSSSKRKLKKSSGNAWKALDSNVKSSFESTRDTLPRALSSLAIGIALSTYSSDATITKMIASAALPNYPSSTSNDNVEIAREQSATPHALARSVVLGLLHLAVVDQDETPKQLLNGAVDLQIVSKIESGFGVGRDCRTVGLEKEESELARAVATIVDCVFGAPGNKNDDDAIADIMVNADTGDIITKDLLTATLSLVANTRPWELVQVERLVRCAAEMNLWYSAEVLADAAMESVDPSKSYTQIATQFPRGAATESLLSSATQSPEVLPQDSIAHRCAGAIIDIAFDYRLYRRADVFASKYYAFGGPERYADARFLHACDTITKLVKKRQVQIIDKQIERVDNMVAKVSKDMMLTPYTQSISSGAEQRKFHGDEIEIETMSTHIRDFTLRRLRATNMHAAAVRLANLWDMEYTQDPLMLEAEAKKRKLTYIQWNDDGCPTRPLPEPISDPVELLSKFIELLDKEETIGFDCEFADEIKYVALLQLSTCGYSLLLDIPALTKTGDGCKALTDTVGKLFRRQLPGVKHLIGFSCREDMKRLRISPSVGVASHWFPQDDKSLFYKDLRSLIAEVNPALGGTRAHQIGLSRACEVFLGKQLDKAEQCSDWLARPLSEQQREYASLDAWSCAAIHVKIVEGMKK